ncbi:TfoX/Sxy family protein [Jatrophihabitans sp. YIM 134969]
MTFDAALAARVRERLRGHDGVTEISMFGGPAFLADGHLTVAVHADDLVVRVGPDAPPDVTVRHGARPFALTGRPVPGWVLVAAGHLDDDELDWWLDRAEAVTATLRRDAPR